MTEEDHLQEACVTWFRLQNKDKIIFAIPKGGKRNIYTGMVLKRTGVLKGVPDLFIPHATNAYNGLFIEIKTKKGVIRPEQKEMLYKLKSEGYAAFVVRSSDDFIELVKLYFKGEKIDETRS